MTDPRITDEAVEAAARTYFENLGWDWDELDTDLKDHGENKAAVLREFRAALEAALPHLAPQPVVDREALEKAIAEALVHHYPTRGMQVASGQTCECQYWTGNEPSALLGAGMGGSDQLNRHRAKLAADAVLALINGSAS
jgi:hypothetical protein